MVIYWRRKYKNKQLPHIWYLNITAHAKKLRDILLEIVKTNEAIAGRRDKFGRRYIIDFILR